MKLKCEVVINEVAGKKVFIPLRENGDGNSVYTVNSTGAFILELLKNEITLEEVISSVSNNFEVEDIESAKAAVTSFLENLKKADLI